MKSSYREEDVKILLKDITGMVQPRPTEERERLIQSGRHYSEMLPVEYVPSPAYMEAYREALAAYAGATAEAVAGFSGPCRDSHRDFAETASGAALFHADPPLCGFYYPGQGNG